MSYIELNTYNPEGRYELPGDIPILPLNQAHYDRLVKWGDEGTLGDATIYTLHNVNGVPVPVRWWTVIEETAQAIEYMQKQGIKSPTKWLTMAPVHMNAKVNGTDAQHGLEQSERLLKMAHEYLLAAHPRVPLPEIQYDNPRAVELIVDLGSKLYPQLPKPVKEKLGNMARHNNKGAQEQSLRAAYLLAHVSAYGLADDMGILPDRVGPSLYVVPQSEHAFIQMMNESVAAVTNAIGRPLRTGEDRVIALSETARTPHYLPHQHEPALVNGWPSDGVFLNGKLHPQVQNEIRQAKYLLQPHQELIEEIATRHRV
ncbi:MAG: hypothetical protein ACEQSA_02805 [Weeksellaceae bacterium]